MFVSHSEIAIEGGRGSLLEAAFRARLGLVDAHDGFLGLELLREVGHRGRYVLVTRWRTREDFRRYVKSEEEILFVGRSAQVAAAALDELIKLARPGVDAGVLYADVIARLLELRSEYYPLALTADVIDTPKPKRYTNPPVGKRLEKNTLITNEVNAISGAQLTQVCQPILLGDIPNEWKPVIKLQKEVYAAGLDLIKPGTAIGALREFVNGFGAKQSMKTLIQMHGCGYGDDGPGYIPTDRAFLEGGYEPTVALAAPSEGLMVKAMAKLLKAKGS